MDCEWGECQTGVEGAYVASALDPDQLTIDDFRFVDLSTTMVAGDVAIVRAALDRRGRSRGRPAAARLLLTDVWKLRVGRCNSSAGTRAPRRRISRSS